MYDPNETGRNAVSYNANNDNIVTALLKDRPFKITGTELGCCCPFHQERRRSFRNKFSNRTL